MGHAPTGSADGVRSCIATSQRGCIGKLCEAKADNLTRSKYSYDSLGRATQVVATVDTAYTVTRSYDAYGRPQVTTYPGGFALRNEYSANGYLVGLKNHQTGAAYWQVAPADLGADGVRSCTT